MRSNHTVRESEIYMIQMSGSEIALNYLTLALEFRFNRRIDAYCINPLIQCMTHEEHIIPASDIYNSLFPQLIFSQLKSVKIFLKTPFRCLFLSFLLNLFRNWGSF